MKIFILLFFFSFIIGNKTVEILSYDAEFKNIGAGSAILKTTTVNNKKEISFSFKAKKIIDLFYKLREKILMKVNYQDYSIEYIYQDSQQGKRIKKHEASFDYINMKAYSNKDTIEITQKVYNPISIISFLRSQQLTLNDEFTFHIYNAGKIKQIKMKVVREEEIRVNSQNYLCFLLAPFYLKDSDSKNKKGEIKLWISQDTRLPIIIEQGADFGEIILTLNHIQYEN